MVIVDRINYYLSNVEHEIDWSFIGHFFNAKCIWKIIYHTQKMCSKRDTMRQNSQVGREDGLIKLIFNFLWCCYFDQSGKSTCRTRWERCCVTWLLLQCLRDIGKVEHFRKKRKISFIWTIEHITYSRFYKRNLFVTLIQCNTFRLHTHHETTSRC